MDPDGFKTQEEAVISAVQPTDMRPDFCAEALSPLSRFVILLTTFVVIALLTLVFVSTAFWPEGLLSAGSFWAVEIAGMLIGLGFLLFVVYGTLAGNNPRLLNLERLTWYVGFVLAMPIAFPAYWFIHVWPVKYEPTSVQRL